MNALVVPQWRLKHSIKMPDKGFQFQVDVGWEAFRDNEIIRDILLVSTLHPFLLGSYPLISIIRKQCVYKLNVYWLKINQHSQFHFE